MTRPEDSRISVRTVEGNDPAAPPDTGAAGGEETWRALPHRRGSRLLARPAGLGAAGRLAAALAHEIRNPLAALTHSVSLLRSSMAPDSSERELADIVLEESERVNRIVSGVLCFARPSRGRRLVELRGVVSETLTLLRREPGHAGDAVELELDAGSELAPLEIDEDRVRQLLWNLLRNAIEAVGGRGRVRVRLRPEEHAGAAGVRVEVCDSGPGVPEALRDQVFDPFRTTKPEGTGLGLALAQQVVEQHAGWISIDDAPEGGARVSFWLPGAAGHGR